MAWWHVKIDKIFNLHEYKESGKEGEGLYQEWYWPELLSYTSKIKYYMGSGIGFIPIHLLVYLMFIILGIYVDNVIMCRLFLHLKLLIFQPKITNSKFKKCWQKEAEAQDFMQKIAHQNRNLISVLHGMLLRRGDVPISDMC